MSIPQNVTSTITFCQVENGITYRIGCEPSSVTIPSDQTEKTFNLALDFHKKEGDNPEEDYDCYWALFRLKPDGTYTLLDYGNGHYATKNNLKAQVSDTDAFVVRIGDSAISSKNSDYAHEAVITVNKNGDTGEKGDTGDSALSVDIDNDSDQFGTDSDGVVLSAQVRSTEVTMYYGTTAQTLNSDTASTHGVVASLFYEDDTQVPTSVAEITKCQRSTSDTTKGEVDVTFKTGTFPSSHTGVYALITATCAKGSRSIAFTIQQVKSGAPGVSPEICNLRPTSTSINFTKNEQKGTTAKPLGCGYTLVTSSGTTNVDVASSVVVNGTTYYIYYKYDGAGNYSRFQPSSSPIYTTGISPSTTKTGVEFLLSSAGSNTGITAANTIDNEHVSILKDGTDGAEGSSPTQYSIVVNSASASVNANGKLSLNVVATRMKTVGETTSESTTGTMACKVGGVSTGISSSVSGNTYTFTLTNGDWAGTYNSGADVVLELTVSSVVVATATVAISIKGKMGRTPYYAGEFNEVKGTRFYPTDTSVPYVSDVPESDSNTGVVSYKIYIYVGENGTKTFPSTSAGYTESEDWEIFETNFKYLMTQVIFTEMAKLGSAYFNEDFMFSQYGSLKGYGGINEPVNNAAFVRFVDPDNMSGDVSAPIDENSTSVTVSSTSFNSSRFSETLYKNRYYFLKVKCTAGTNRGVEFKITTAGGSEDVLNPTITDSEMHIYRFSVPEDGTYLMYYRRTGTVTTNPTIDYTMLSDCNFCPNIYADWLKGFFYTQYGKFKNVVIEGVFNNLITEIDWDNNINRDLIISYTESSTTKYCLDVLRCGNMVRIKSLPSGLNTSSSSSTEKYLRIPYFISDTANERTRTKLAKDGTTLTTARRITADEMRMLVGRKLVLILDADIGWEYTYIRSHKATPNGIEGGSPSISNLKGAIVDVANGQPHIKDSGSLSSLEPIDVKINYKKTVYMECRLIRDVDHSRYCYIWTCTTADALNGTGEPIDNSWT